METYIVRIYRRAGKPPSEPTGTVEHVGSGKRSGFVGRDELLSRLHGTGTNSTAAPARDSIDPARRRS